MYVGLGYTLVARNVENQTDRKDLLSKAEHHYKAAFELDRYDHLCQYYIALHYAETRRPEQAMKAVKNALELNPEHIAAIQLTILLLSGMMKKIVKIGSTIKFRHYVSYIIRQKSMELKFECSLQS